jgi:hypothetical protein
LASGYGKGSGYRLPGETRRDVERERERQRGRGRRGSGINGTQCKAAEESRKRSLETDRTDRLTFRGSDSLPLSGQVGSLKIERHLEAEKSFLPGQEMVHMTFADEERGPRQGLHGLRRGQKEGRTPAGVVDPLGCC